MGKRIAYRLFIRIPLWILVASALLVTVLKWVPVRYTPIMLARAVQFCRDQDYHTRQTWVPLEQCSPELIQSIIACEDRNFFLHRGFDWDELKNMKEEHEKSGKPIRGCSTLSQQTAKNVFTLGTRTWIRKANEAYWTVLIELFWGKRRIAEVYLNVIETGRGIFGVEEAAQHYYGIHAAEMDYPQSTALAVCLPDPLQKNPLNPDAKDLRQQKRVNSRRHQCRFPDWAK